MADSERLAWVSLAMVMVGSLGLALVARALDLLR